MRKTRGHNLIAEQLEPGYVQTQALLEKKFPRTAAWTRQQISQGVPAKDAVDSVAKLYGVTGAKGVAYNPAEAAIARSRGEHVVAGGDGKYYYQPSPDKDVDLKIQQNWNKDRANLIGEYAGKNRITNEDVAFNASPIGAVGAATAAVVGKRVGVGGNTVLRQSGAGGAAAAADDAYAAIRASSSDVGTIAKNTGIKPSNIQKVKDHLFNDEHLLDRYESLGVPGEMKRFDSNIDIADAWKRLKTGTYTPADIQLLRHETAEAWYMRKYGPSYNNSHNAAQGRYPSPLE